MKADQAVQASQDKLDMLTARYDVRRGELDAAGNEFIGAIDAQKNVLTLEESRRRLQQLEQDAGSADRHHHRRARRRRGAPQQGARWRWSARRGSSTTSWSRRRSTAWSR